MRITSTQNAVIRYVRSLARAPERRRDEVYIAEGVRLVTEAVETGQDAAVVLYDPTTLHRSEAGSVLLELIPSWADRSFEVDQRVLTAAAQVETPGGVLAILRFPRPVPLASHGADPLGLFLDGLADPGNAGTILRAAAAFDAGYVVTLPQTVDLFGPKVVRAGMGAHFRLPIYSHVSWTEVRASLPGVVTVVADAGGGEPLASFDWPDYTGLVIGGEAAGPSREARDTAGRRVHIPLERGVESLNAAAAASIILYAFRDARA